MSGQQQIIWRTNNYVNNKELLEQPWPWHEYTVYRFNLVGPNFGEFAI